MRFHVIGLPNYPTGTNTACAYGEKVRKFIKMMTARGHECVHYGLEGSKVDCEHVTTMDLDEQEPLAEDKLPAGADLASIIRAARKVRAEALGNPKPAALWR